MREGQFRPIIASDVTDGVGLVEVYDLD